jgi:uncharacterized membrane protein YhiD involved in acid resistance
MPRPTLPRRPLWPAIVVALGAAAVVASAMLIGVSAEAAPSAPQTTPPTGAPPAPPPQAFPPALPPGDADVFSLDEAMVRLPLAAVLGAALALRPKRRGTPERSPAVVETQIVLAVVGAVIMLVVGASLARAFGIVGAANLIRYRSKIEDPKDAVVMLCALAVGLASGVGLYTLAIFSTIFLVASLWVIESFEPQARNRFELSIKFGENTDEQRPGVEAVLARQRIGFQLRTISDEALAYDVRVPLGVDTKQVTDALLKLDSSEHGAVEWLEKSKKDR